MINKEIILNADGTIKKDFSDRAIPQNSNNQVSVNVLIPSTCFTGLQNYAVILAVSRIISNVETTLNTLVMSVSKSITIDGVVYVKYTSYLDNSYTEKIGVLKFSPYIQTTATVSEGGTTSEVISIQQSFTNSNLNVIKSVLPQYDASLEEGTIATTLEGQINGKKIYTFIDDATSEGEHYYNLVDGFNPSADQFKGCLVVSVWNGTSYIMPYLNDGVELLEITKDGVSYRISNVSYADNTYTFTKQKLTYTKTDVDGIETSLQNQIDALNTNKVDKTTKVNNHALSSDITLQPSDIQLGNVKNYDVESTPTASGSELYITSKGVYDYCQVIYGIINGLATESEITAINGRLESIEEIIGSDSGDADSVINTLKEVIVVLNGLGEGANLLDLINAKANQSDLTALNNQINGEDGIKDKVDILSERENAYMEIKNSLGTIDIAVSDWVENTGDTNYPYKWELTNGYLEGAVNCIVVYSKDSDTSMLSATTGIDEENGKLIIYASELPSDTISIEKIAVFNDLNAYINYSNEIVQQVLSNTSAISDINNTKLPLYLKKQGSFSQIEHSTSKLELSYKKTGKGSTLTLGELNSFIKSYRNTNDTNGITTFSINNHRVGSDDLISLKLKADDEIKLEVGSTPHTLTFDANGDLKIDGNAVGGGGKQLYQHNIIFGGSSKQRVNIIIKNEQSTQMNMTDILAYFTQKGVNSTNKYPAYGQISFVEGNGCDLAQFVYQDGNYNRLQVEGFNTTSGNPTTGLINPSSSSYGINDYVIPL